MPDDVGDVLEAVPSTFLNITLGTRPAVGHAAGPEVDVEEPSLSMSPKFAPIGAIGPVEPDLRLDDRGNRPAEVAVETRAARPRVLHAQGAGDDLGAASGW